MPGPPIAGTSSRRDSNPSLMADVTIRAYRPHDRAIIRRIACDTADLGRPIDSVFRDRDLVAEALTAYYTDYEPGSLWIAEHDARVVGYLTGCLESRRYWPVMARRVVPKIAGRALWRGSVWNRQVLWLLRAAWGTWKAGGLSRPFPSEFPAHLHVNLEPEFRGRGAGAQLVDRFVQQLKAARVRGAHASVSERNEPACRFFERLGFVALRRDRVVRPQDEPGDSSRLILYGKIV